MKKDSKDYIKAFSVNVNALFAILAVGLFYYFSTNYGILEAFIVLLPLGFLFYTKWLLVQTLLNLADQNTTDQNTTKED